MTDKAKPNKEELLDNLDKDCTNEGSPEEIKDTVREDNQDMPCTDSEQIAFMTKWKSGPTFTFL